MDGLEIDAGQRQVIFPHPQPCGAGTIKNVNSTEFLSDISTETANRAFYGVSQDPDGRGERQRQDYAASMADDYQQCHAQAVKGGTLDMLEGEFARYRAGMRQRNLAYLHSSARCVSWFIAGPSNFPAARMAKRSDICHKRLNEMLEFRSRALAAIKRALRPDLRAIYAGDSNALERLEAKLTGAEALQLRMRATNAAIRRTAKAGPPTQIAALLGMGYTEGAAHRLLAPDFCGRIGFPDFELTNNSASIRRMKQRVESITRLQATPASEAEGTNARLEDAPQDNRVRLFFPGKPDETVRTRLKSSGFRWTPSLGCWQAFRNHWALVLAKEIAGVAVTA